MLLSSPLRSALQSFASKARFALLLAAFIIPAGSLRAQIIFTNLFFTNTVQLSTNAYQVSENGSYIDIKVVRLADAADPFNLLSGVSVDYAVTDGTARNLVDYKATSGTLQFGSFQEEAFFTVFVYDNNLIDGNRTVNINLSHPQISNGGGFFGGDVAVLGSPSAAILTIVDDEGASNPVAAGSVQWSTNSYEVFHDESDSTIAHGDNSPLGGVITLVRPGGTKGKILVDWQTTTNGVRGVGFDTNFFFFFGFGARVAIPGIDYVQTTGTVEFADYQMSANVLIPILANPTPRSPYSTNLLVGLSGAGDSQFNVAITGVRAAPGEDPILVQPQIGARDTAAVMLRDNQYGLGFAFERAHYSFNEGTPTIEVWVKRSPSLNPPSSAVLVHYTQNPLFVTGDFLWNTWPLDASSDYATPFVDWEPKDDMLVWSETDGDLKKRIVLPIHNDSEVEFNEDIYLYLYKVAGESDSFVNPSARTCHVTIRFDDQPAGSYDRTFNLDNSATTTPPFNGAPGANFDVNAIVAQPDGKILVGGDFDKINTTPRNHIARMNNNGSLDASFIPGVGADGSVHAIALQSDGKILIGGDFTSYNGTQRYGIARLNSDGSLDVPFNPGLGTRDANGLEASVRTIAIQDSGKILIGGEFTKVNGTNANYLARLNSDGSFDPSFAAGKGPDGPVYSIALGSRGLEFKGSSSSANFTDIARTAEQHFGPYDTGSKSGSITIEYTFIDPSQLRVHYEGNVIFDSGIGTNSQATTVTIPYFGNSTLVEVAMNETPTITAGRWYFAVKIQPDSDSRPVLGGNFTSYDGANINYIARITQDGVLDPTFNKIGTGADNFVYSVAKQGNKIIMGGAFSAVDLRSRNGIARLNEDGGLDTTYTPGSGANDTVYTVSLDLSGKVLAGGLFTSINTTRRVGIARLNFDGTVDTSFMDTAYNQFAGLINPFSPEVSPENFLRTMAPYRLTNIVVSTNFVLDPGTQLTNQIVVTNFVLKDQIFVGGHFSQIGGGFSRDDIRRQTSVTRLIGGETPGPGNIGFVQTTYTADEASGNTFITMVRTNGTLAEAHATFGTADFPPGPGIAIGGSDYTPANRVAVWGTTYGQDADRQKSAARMGPNYLSFDTNRTTADFTNYIFPSAPGARVFDNTDNKIFVSIADDTLIEGDEAADMIIATPGSILHLGGVPIPVGTALGLAEAKLVIADNDFNYGSIGFSSPTYVVNENGTNALITLTRLGGTAGSVSVHYDVQDGTAQAGQDYTRVSGDLTFASGKDTASFTVPIIDDTVAELEETINLVLSRPNGQATLDTNRSTAVLTIIDNDFAPGRISFLSQSFSVNEADGSVTVTVQRRGGNLGDVSVNFATTNGTAQAGIDYMATNGVLHWVSGDTSPRTFTVAIIPNDIIESADNKFGVVLSNPVVSSSSDFRLLGNVPAAVITIVNDDFSGGFAFSQPVYNVDENGGEAIITVLRQGGSAGTNQVFYTVTNLVSGGAVAGKDFAPVTSSLNFGSNEISKSFIVKITNNSDVDGDRDIQLILSKPAVGTIISSNAVLTIIDDELNRIPAGTVDSGFGATGTDDFIYSVAQQADQSLIIAGDFVFINNIARNRMARLLSNGAVDATFDPSLGANGSIRSIDFENDGRIVLGGLFTSVNGTNRNYLARINVNATVDPTFNPGSGTDNPIFALATQDDGKIVAVGAFSSFNGQPRNGVVRILTNGLMDPFFTPGTGADAPVYSLAVQSDGKIVLGGGFSRFNGAAAGNLVRLNRDGTVDSTFKIASASPDSSVRAIAIQSDGKIVIGGLFHHVGTNALNQIARLNPDGSVDSGFNPGIGANGSVGVIRIQIDGKLVLGGDFTQFDGVSRNRITRLNPDGSNDPSINIGSGANSTISDILIQADRKIVLVGGFTEFNGVPKSHIVRIHGGSLDGSGSVEFTSGGYSAAETGTNAIVTLRRTGGTFGSITVDYQTTPGTAVPGQDYTPVQGTATFAPGETEVILRIPVFPNPNVPGDKTFTVSLSNPSGGATLGLQPSAIVTIMSASSVIGFDSATYSVTENSQAGTVAVTVRRDGATSGSTSVNVFTADGTAKDGVNYTGIRQTLTFAPGEISKTFSIPIINDNIVDFDKTFSVNLTNLVGGGSTLGLSQAIVTVVNVQIAPGNLGFATSTYSVVEGNNGTRTNAAITVRRTGGSSGVVSIDFATTTNGTALVNVKFLPVSGTLSFADGETEKSFLVPVIGNDIVEGNQSVGLKLSNPQGGAALVGSATSFLTIVDDDFGPGSVDQGFNPGTGATKGAVRSLVLEPGGSLLIGGDFTNYNGVSRARVARVHTDGSLDASFNTNSVPNNSVAAVALQGSKVVIAGGFNMVNNLIRQGVARLTSAGVLDPVFSLPLGFDDEVSTLAIQIDGAVLVGGRFDQASAAKRNHIARLTADGTVDSSFNVGTGTDKPVNAIALDFNQNVLIGGAFNTMNGFSRKGIARLTPFGGVDGTFQPGTGADGAVNAIQVLSDGKILIAGDFTSYNGTNRSRIARLNSDGSLDLAFNPPTIDHAIYALGLQFDGKIFIGGDFTSLDALSRNRIARLNADGSIETGPLGGQFNPGEGANDTVLDLTVQPDGKVVIVGRFTAVDGISRVGIARLNGDRISQPMIDLASVQRVNGQITFQFSTQPGRLYVVERSADFETWDRAAGINAQGTTATFTESSATPVEFYRVRLGP